MKRTIKQIERQEVSIMNGKKVRNVRYAHEQVVEVAKGIAHALYESMMKDNETNAVWKKFCEDLERDEHEEEFVRLAWPHLLDDARATLSRLLGQPGKEHLKEQIFDVLMKDNLIRGTGGLAPVHDSIMEAQRHGR